LDQSQASDTNPVILSQRRFAQVLRQLGLEQDVDGLKQFRSQLTKQFKSTHKKLYKLREIIVSCIIMDTEDRHSLLSPEDSKFVSNYLFERDIWYTLEYVLYSDCVPFLQPADFEKLYNKFLTIHFSFRQRGDYMDLFFQSFYNTAVALYYRQAYSPAIQTLDRLKEQQIPDSLFSIRLHLRLLRRLCQYKLTNSTETAAELSELVKVISKISPAFGRRWKAEFQFHEPVSDHA
jgi:Rgg/GadR/MutR family transcriptional activator